MHPRHLYRALAVGALTLLLGGFLAGCIEKKIEFPLTVNELAKTINFEQLREDALTAALVKKSDRDIVSRYGSGNVRIFFDENNYGKFFIATDDEAKVQTISIRGTTSINDFGDGLDVRTAGRVFSNGETIRYHRGFVEETNSLYGVARGHLNSAYRLRIIGHSRGGGMGLILYKILTDTGHDPGKVEVVTFGQPKITNRDGANKYGRLNLIRVINGRDIVPRYPFFDLLSSMYGRYIQFGNAIYLWDNNEWSVALSDDERMITRKQFFPKDLRARVKLHPINRYIDKLKKMAELPDKQAKRVKCCLFKDE